MDLIDHFRDKKIIFFGAGNAGNQALSLFPLTVAYFVDNDNSRWNQEFSGKMIFAPQVLSHEDKASIAIIITSMFYQEISHQLKQMGFKENEHFWNWNYLKSFLKHSSLNIPHSSPYKIKPQSRYGYGKPPHQKLDEIIGRNNQIYRHNLEYFQTLINFFQLIPSHPVQEENIPYWSNNWFSGLDAVSLYGFLANQRPRCYIEVGSGNSTKFAWQAIKDLHLSTHIISIDPQPRSGIDSICNEIIREPLEDVNLGIFSRLNFGDILFVDNSHQVFMNSDVAVTFLDILPYLKPGVLVGFHDIFLPYDYPPEWANRLYTEQYLLASYLLAEGSKIEVQLPVFYINQHQELKNIMNPFWSHLNLEPKGGAAFWIKML